MTQGSGTFCIGPATIAVDGTDSVARLARSMFADAATTKLDVADLRLQVARPTEIDDAISSMTNQRFPYRFETVIRADGARLRLRMRRRGGRPLTTVDITGFPGTSTPWSATATLHIAPLLARIAPFVQLPTKLSGRRLDYIFFALLSDMLEPLLWLQLLDHHSMLVHAGAVKSPKGCGVLIIGASHAGKTATVLELAINSGWDFVGDDLVVVGPTGMNRLPTAVRLRSHHVALVRNLPAEALRGRRGVVRQLAPSVLIPPARIASHAAISLVIRLVTTPNGSPEVVPISREMMIHQAVAGLFDEYWQFMRGINSIATIDDRAAGLHTIYDQSRAGLASAIGDAPVYELRVPMGTPAADIADIVSEIVY
ncbi:MAG: hypothetical protein WD360_03330 [Nitriliruptoraceae bacterium]